MPDRPEPTDRPDPAHLPRDAAEFGEAVLAIVRRNYPSRAAELVAPMDLIFGGKHLGRLAEIDVRAVNRLMLQVQPAHLQTVVGRDLAGDELREARATLVRNGLGCT